MNILHEGNLSIGVAVIACTIEKVASLCLEFGSYFFDWL
jgi:hypothetical protein